MKPSPPAGTGSLRRSAARAGAVGGAGGRQDFAPRAAPRGRSSRHRIGDQPIPAGAAMTPGG